MTAQNGAHAKPEALWMAEVAGGSQRAFRCIVEKYQRHILNLAYRFTGDRTLSQDLAQDIFLKVYQSASRYRPEARFTTWLYRVAVNHCLNDLRDHARAERLRSTLWGSSHSDDDVSGSAITPASRSPEELLGERENAVRIRQAIQNLPARQRMAVVLHRYHGFRYAEIAQTMDCSVAAVESLLVRAMDGLRHELQDLDQSKADPPRSDEGFP